ncbi:MAG: virulence protein RhuM/Fic/DOC family protein [Bacteroidales bacterium]|nr:virulence protein RhuM/Fic/DOC family protein [Bacteroidales bacterium]
MENKQELTNSIVIYQTSDGETSIDVKFQDETVWLSQAQMAELFQKDRTVIGRHIANIFKEGELEESLVCVKFAHAKDYGRREGFTQKTETTLYNLDVIISVGYRVKSKRGTQFRIWANKVLKQYLLQGYVINERMTAQKYDELSQLVKVLGRTIQNQEKLTEDSRSLLDVVVDYTYALDTLDRYDYQNLTIEQTTGQEVFHATYENAMEVIRELHHKFGGSDLFGNEKDDSFKSSIGQIYQTFGGIDLYPSVEEKAAMLLYLVTKNHSFSDGNKRIAATLFLWFLNGNGILYNEDGSKRIADNTLVALTLMIAESRTEEKDTMVKVIVNLINKNN